MPPNVHRPEDVDAYLERLDHPLKAEVQARRPALEDLVRQWVPAPFTSLGTDGFGLSDTRPAVRRHFNVDAESITVAALATLAAEGALDRSVAVDAAAKYRIHDPQAAGPQTSDPGVA